MLASVIGQLGHPFYDAFAWLLAASFALIPNYAVAIALLTVVVMVGIFPITLRSTRAMVKMQLLAPEIKKLQAKHKVRPEMTIVERQELRQRQQEELMALYRENNVSPAGGCLPMFLQFPVFIVLYGTIRGLIHLQTVNGLLRPDPLYVSHTSSLYLAIEHAHGQLVSFGLNLADSLRSTGIGWGSRISLVVLIVVAVALQYVQMKQASGRNPQAGDANPQMQQLQRIFPLVFAVIYISIPLGVNIYFIVSSLFRIAQQELMYRRDPRLQASLATLRGQAGSG
jgi:YidC/Oxa1 family membrane protein insertase